MKWCCNDIKWQTEQVVIADLSNKNTFSGESLVPAVCLQHVWLYMLKCVIYCASACYFTCGLMYLRGPHCVTEIAQWLVAYIVLHVLHVLLIAMLQFPHSNKSMQSALLHIWFEGKQWDLSVESFHETCWQWGKYRINGIFILCDGVYIHRRLI